MRLATAVVASIFISAAPSLAQEAAPSTPASVAATSTAVPAGTILRLRVDKEVSSKTAKVGDRFDLSLVEDVMLGSAVAIPKGARAVGEVTERSGRGAMGKSAKLSIQFRTIALGGRDYAIQGDGRNKGKKNTAAQIGMFLLFGPFAGAISGKSARFKQGEIFEARTVEPIPISAT
jgi:hypothetical protein